MATSLEVTMVLCDAVQVAEGKLWMLGAGWTRIAANTPAPQGLGVIAHVPYDLSNQKFRLEIQLLDADGQAVTFGEPPLPVGSEGEFEVGRPPGVKPGETFAVPMAFRFNGLFHPPGGYVWECKVDGEVLARLPFQAVE